MRLPVAAWQVTLRRGQNNGPPPEGSAITPSPLILITRPLGQAQAFAAALGADVATLISPLMEITPVATDPVTADHLIFTSANGVAQAERLLADRKAVAWCVGAKTAQAAREAGFQVRSADGDSTDLIALMQSHRPEGRIVHIAGRHVTGDIIEALNDAGLPSTRVTAYDQTYLPPSDQARDAVAGAGAIVLPLFSARSAQAAGALRPIRAPLHVIAISESTARAAAKLGPVSVTIANTPDNKAMIAAVLMRYEALLPPTVS